jgi:hypothetical protein
VQKNLLFGAGEDARAQAIDLRPLKKRPEAASP